jgi:hypothetical protein
VAHPAADEEDSARWAEARLFVGRQEASMGTEKSYGLSPGAFAVQLICGVVLCLLVITLPLGLLIIWLARRSRVTVSDTGLTVQSGLSTSSFLFKDVRRIGRLEETNRTWVDLFLCWEEHDGTTHLVPLHAFEGCRAIFWDVAARSRMPVYIMRSDWLGHITWTDMAVEELRFALWKGDGQVMARGHRRAA